MVTHRRGAVFDQRRNPRYFISAQAVIEPLSHDETQTERIKVMIHDIALTGLMLASDRPLPTGSSWRLCIYDNQHLLTSVPVVVRNCTPSREGEHRVGMQVMFEPFFLTWLGVSRRSIEAEEWDHEDRVTRP